MGRGNDDAVRVSEELTGWRFVLVGFFGHGFRLEVGDEIALEPEAGTKGDESPGRALLRGLVLRALPLRRRARRAAQDRRARGGGETVAAAVPAARRRCSTTKNQLRK